MLELILSLFIFFNVFFVIAVIRKDLSIIDVAWGLSFFLIYIFGYVSLEKPVSLRVGVIGILVGIWSIRLSGYI